MLIDLFVEDAAHEELLKGLVFRIAAEEDVVLQARVRSATGGHPRALSEFRLYQRVAAITSADHHADLVVVAIDGNCKSFAETRKRVLAEATPMFRDRVITACPDPHIERWYLADLQAFRTVVGHGPKTVPSKCARSHYKGVLESAIREAGHPASDGVDFGAGLAAGMDLYHAGKADPSLKAFLDDFRAALKQVAPVTGATAS